MEPRTQHAGPLVIKNRQYFIPTHECTDIFALSDEKIAEIFSTAQDRWNKLEDERPAKGYQLYIEGSIGGAKNNPLEVYITASGTRKKGTELKIPESDPFCKLSEELAAKNEGDVKMAWSITSKSGCELVISGGDHVAHIFAATREQQLALIAEAKNLLAGKVTRYTLRCNIGAGPEGHQQVGHLHMHVLAGVVKAAPAAAA